MLLLFSEGNLIFISNKIFPCIEKETRTSDMKLVNEDHYEKKTNECVIEACLIPKKTEIQTNPPSIINNKSFLHSRSVLFEWRTRSLFILNF